MNLPPITTSNGTRYVATMDDWPHDNPWRTDDTEWDLSLDFDHSPGERIIQAAFGFALALAALFGAALAVVVDHLLNRSK